MLLLIFFDGIDRDLCGFILRKSENAGRDTTESNTLTAVFLCDFQA